MASTYNMSIKQNTNFSRSIVWKDKANNPIDLTGRSAHLVAKRRYSDTIPAMNLSNESGNIDLGTTNGSITIKSFKSENKVIPHGVYLYDLFINDYHLLTGEITITRSSYNG